MSELRHILGGDCCTSKEISTGKKVPGEQRENATDHINMGGRKMHELSMVLTARPSNLILVQASIMISLPVARPKILETIVSLHCIMLFFRKFYMYEVGIFRHRISRTTVDICDS